jgi:hypothetical protein
MLRPKNSTIFGDYCADVFLQYVLTMLKTKDRVNIVFDVYKDNSLKSGIRQQRGTGRDWDQAESNPQYKNSWELGFLFTGQPKQAGTIY